MTPVADPNRVLMFDTTLRGGKPSAGCSMTQPVPEEFYEVFSCLSLLWG
jgi:hypothetical protein